MDLSVVGGFGFFAFVCLFLPVNDVGQEIIVFESVVDVDFLVVDGQRSRFDAALLKFDWKFDEKSNLSTILISST